MLKVDTSPKELLSYNTKVAELCFELTLSQTQHSEPIVLSSAGSDIKITGGSHHGEAHNVALRLHGDNPEFGLVGSGHLLVKPETVSLRLEEFTLGAPLLAFKRGLEQAFPGRWVEVVQAQ